MRLFTIGFTKKNARRFFDTLRASGTKRVVDVRLNNVSQLAGFAKKDDLAYFLEKIGGIDYVHLPALAPTQEMLDESVRRILRVKFLTGLFDNPYVDPARAGQVMLLPAHREHARAFAQQTTVLLKNRAQL